MLWSTNYVFEGKKRSTERQKYSRESKWMNLGKGIGFAKTAKNEKGEEGLK